MQARFFTQPYEIEAAFPRLLPMFARIPAIDYAHDDLKQRALAGTLMLGMAEENGNVVAAMAFERVTYPCLRAINIVAFAGSRMDALVQKFWGLFCDWCQHSGIQAIEARCGDGMTRLLEKYGFNKVTNVLRISLED